MKVYSAGPLFNAAERGFLDQVARRLRASGFDRFLPHEHEMTIPAPTPEPKLDQGS